MIVYLIRHGETALNKQKRLQGQSDYELNEYGRELARVTGEALRQIPFDMAISSPLSRALETAKLVLGERRIPLVTDKRIQEISFGSYEGLCFGEEGYNIPDEGFLKFFHAPEAYVAPPKGESIDELIERTGAFWKELTEKPEYQDKTILVSTHGGALKAILAGIRQTEKKDFWGTGVHKNCAVTMIEVVEGKTTVLEEGKIYYS